MRNDLDVTLFKIAPFLQELRVRINLRALLLRSCRKLENYKCFMPLLLQSFDMNKYFDTNMKKDSSPYQKFKNASIEIYNLTKPSVRIQQTFIYAKSFLEL